MGVADLVEILNAATRLEIVMVQIFAARKILDIHLQSAPWKFKWESELDDHPGNQISKMHQNFLSSETLVYAWNIWKQKIGGVVDSLGKTDECSEDGSWRLREFCIDYAGFQRNSDRNYIVYYPDAFFLSESGHRSFKKDGKLSLIENDQFVSVARGYWVSELLSVGMKVLAHLESFSRFCTGKTLSTGCRGVAVLRIFQLSKFLINFQLAYTKSDSKSLQDTLAASKSCFFDIVFPIDWRLAIAESMLTLREKDLAKELLKEVIVDSINGKLTYGKIGRVAMICTVSKLDEQLYETISNHLGETIPWKMFIEQLRNKEPGCEQRILVASSLRDALSSTFDINWHNEIDYISPPCFLYLLERLLFTVSARQPYFFVTKSSFAEFLGSDSWCCFEVDAYDHVFFTESINFFSYLFQQILFDQSGTIQWIVNSKLTVQYYYPSLVFKLIIMLGIVYINSGLLLNMLVDVLKFKNIIRVLPKEFYGYLQGVGENNFRDKFATALMSAGDPLVTVKLTRDFSNIIKPYCLSVDMSIKRSRDDVMNMLFPKNSSVPRQSEPHREPGTLVDTCISPDSIVGEHEIKLASSDMDICKKKTATIEGDYDLQKGYDHICSTLDALVLEHKRGGSDYSVVASELKMNVESYLAILDSKMSIADQSTINGVDKLNEVKCLLDELMKLGTELDGRGNALDEIVDRLKKGRPRFQPLFNLSREVRDSKENSVEAATASVKSDHGNKGTSNNPKQQKKSKKKGRKGRK